MEKRHDWLARGEFTYIIIYFHAMVQSDEKTFFCINYPTNSLFKQNNCSTISQSFQFKFQKKFCVQNLAQHILWIKTWLFFFQPHFKIIENLNSVTTLLSRLWINLSNLFALTTKNLLFVDQSISTKEFQFMKIQI